MSDDPAFGSETQAESTGVTPAPQERAGTRKQLAGSEESPARLGDHYEQSKGLR